MKKQLLLLLMMLSPMMALAYDAEIDGIYYNFNGTEAEVTSGDYEYAVDVVIPERVTYNETEYSVVSIGNEAFYGCRSLTSITIPESVTSIGFNAFRSCYSLTSITIPNGVTSIGAYVFEGCIGLTSITIGNSVTSIGYSAFGGCRSLTSITIPNSVTNIGDEAFYACSRLSSITIPNSVTSIGEGAFYACGLTSITIPNSVTSIGEYAFGSCSGLTSITIPNSVTSIGGQPFWGCSGLTSINVEEENTKYDSRGNCNAIIETSSNTLIVGCQNTTIPNSVTSIGGDAFGACSGLTSITIPNSVTSIGEGAFYGCSGLTSITIPKSVTSIGENPFVYCNGLTSIVVEDRNTKYDSRNNSNAIIETSSNTLIVGCQNTTIPNSVMSIGDCAFRNCRVLTSITIPNSVMTIGVCAFYGCNGLTSITIPNGVKSIGIAAFEECIGLTSITIGNSVTSIGWYAFEDCSNLIDVYCYAEAVPTTGGSIFLNTPIDNAVLHVLAASIDSYKTTAPWSGFKEIVESDYLDVTDLNIKAGESNVQEISLNNGLTDLVGFQMDLMLPEGVAIDKAGCALSSRITDNEQELTIGKLESGTYRITSTSLSLIPISGNDGTLLSLKLTAEDGCIGGQATISNIVFSTAESEKIVMSDKSFDISILYNLIYKVDGEEYKTSSVAYGSALTAEAEPTKEGYTFGGWSEIPETMPNHDVEITGRFYLFGDVNTDEDVDVVDVVDIARFVVATPSVSFREKLADLNFDNMVNIADAVTLVNYIAGDQNFARAIESYNYDQCQLQLVSTQGNALSLCLNGDADFTAFQFEVELPENTDITAMRINGQRMDDHQILYNKVADNHYRVAVLSLSNAVFKGDEGELLNLSIDGLPTEEICIHNILFVTKNGTAITFDDISLSEVTGIANYNANEGNNVIFDLQGRKLSKAQRGVNIVNGKKVVVK